MLWKRDLRFTYFFLMVYSKLCLIPIQIDPKTLKMTRETRMWKLVVNGTHRIAMAVHLIFITWRLVEATVNFEPGMLRHFGCAVLCNVVILAIRIEDYEVLFVYLDLTISLNNALMKHYQENEGRDKSRNRNGNRWTRWSSWTLQEFYLAFAGAGIFSLLTVHLTLYFLTPHSFNFVHSLTPAEYQNVVTILIGAVVEVYVTFGFIAVGTFCAHQNLMLYRACEQKLDRAIKKIWKENQRQLEKGTENTSPFFLDSVYKTCQEVRMWVHLFNCAYRLSTFTHKIFYMSTSVFCLFIAIYLLQSQPVIAALYFWIGFVLNVQFVIVYEKTYKIPDGIAHLKKEMQVGNFFIPSKFELRKLVNSKLIQALPVIGIQVGSFRVMERETVPMFVDFVIGKVVDLIITF